MPLLRLILGRKQHQLAPLDGRLRAELKGSDPFWALMNSVYRRGVAMCRRYRSSSPLRLRYVPALPKHGGGLRLHAEGVRGGIITPERLAEAVTRILATKAALGLHLGQPALEADEALRVVGCEEHRAWARAYADSAITLVKEENGVIPLTAERYPRILVLPIEKDGGYSQNRVVSGACQKAFDALEKRGMRIELFEPPRGAEGRPPPPASEVIAQYDLILYVVKMAAKSNQTTVRIEWAQPMGANCMHYLHDVPAIFVSLGNPYHLLDVPRVKTYITPTVPAMR